MSDAAPASEGQAWPGATLAELSKYLDTTYGQRGWLTRDGKILVYGDQDGALEKRWWVWGEVRDYCREKRR